MTAKKSYNRYFIIFQEEDKGYGIAIDKQPTGYTKIETRNGRCKVTVYAQNLVKDRGPYLCCLIDATKSPAAIAKLGAITVDETGRGETWWEYREEDVAETGIPVDRFNVAAVIVDGDELKAPLTGYIGRDKITWKDKIKPQANEVKEEIKDLKDPEEVEELDGEARKFKEYEEMIKNQSAQGKGDSSEASKDIRKEEHIKSEPQSLNEEDDSQESRKEAKNSEESDSPKESRQQDEKRNKKEDDSKTRKELESKKASEKNDPQESRKEAKNSGESDSPKESRQQDEKRDKKEDNSKTSKELESKEANEKDDSQESRKEAKNSEERGNPKKSGKQDKKSDKKEDNSKTSKELESKEANEKDDSQESRKETKNSGEDDKPKGSGQQGKEKHGQGDNPKTGEEIESQDTEDDSKQNDLEEEDNNPIREAQNKAEGKIPGEPKEGHQVLKDNNYYDGVGTIKDFDEGDRYTDYEDIIADVANINNQFDDIDYREDAVNDDWGIEYESVRDGRKKRRRHAHMFHEVLRHFREMEDPVDGMKGVRWWRIPHSEDIPIRENSLYPYFCSIYHLKMTYPYINYIKYYKKPGYYYFGIKYDSNGEVKYIMYGIEGRNSALEQPYMGMTGFTKWHGFKSRDRENGMWVMYYNPYTGYIMIPKSR